MANTSLPSRLSSECTSVMSGAPAPALEVAPPSPAPVCSSVARSALPADAAVLRTMGMDTGTPTARSIVADSTPPDDDDATPPPPLLPPAASMLPCEEPPTARCRARRVRSLIGSSASTDAPRGMEAAAAAAATGDDAGKWPWLPPVPGCAVAESALADAER